MDKLHEVILSEQAEFDVRLLSHYLYGYLKSVACRPEDTEPKALQDVITSWGKWNKKISN